MCGRNAVESGSGGREKSLESGISFWHGQVILTLLEKLWVLRFNYSQVQLEMSVEYLSGYDHQAAAYSNLKRRPHVMAQDIDFAVINIEKVTATKVAGIEWMSGAGVKGSTLSMAFFPGYSQSPVLQPSGDF